MTPPDLFCQRSPSFHSTDVGFMHEALALGEKGLGSVAPNPSVGCIIVNNGIICGKGRTQPGGRPHAEAIALKDAGDKTINATMYVTLEPCSHRTVDDLSCVERIFFAKIRHVIAAIKDPNPAISGLGLALLRSFGVQTSVGLCKKEALHLHKGHILRITQKRPFIQLKLALSCDGYIALPQQRTLLTGQESQNYAHLLRARADAILVGIETVLIDNPELTCRLKDKENLSPIRIVLDSLLRLGTIMTDCPIFKTLDTIPLWIFTSFEAPESTENFLHQKGIRVFRVSRETKTQRLDLVAIVEKIAQNGITRLLVEGGSKIAAAFLKQNIIDELILLQSPTSLGNRGIPPFHGMMLHQVIPDFSFINKTLLGMDYVSVYRRL